MIDAQGAVQVKGTVHTWSASLAVSVDYMQEQPSPQSKWFRNRFLHAPMAYIFLWVLAIWFIEIVDSFVLDDRLQANGIRPRDTSGLTGIVWSPFLYSNFGHVFSNTAPFVAMGFLVSLRDKNRWFVVTFTAMLGGGLLTWLFAAGGNHIGLSGIVFSYFGYLLGYAFFTRSVRSMAIAAVTGFLYGTMLLGLVPRPGISWEGHLSGVAVGVIIAAIYKDERETSKARQRTEPQAWEADEPWLE